MSHVDEGLLHAYLDGAFPPGDAEHDAISAHLALCGDCRTRLEAARTARELAVAVLRQLAPAAAPSRGGFVDVVARADVVRRDAAAAAPVAAAGGAAGTAGAGGRTPLRRIVPLAWAASVALAIAAGWIARQAVLPPEPPRVAAGGGIDGAEAREAGAEPSERPAPGAAGLPMALAAEPGGEVGTAAAPAPLASGVGDDAGPAPRPAVPIAEPSESSLLARGDSDFTAPGSTAPAGLSADGGVPSPTIAGITRPAGGTITTRAAEPAPPAAPGGARLADRTAALAEPPPAPLPGSAVTVLGNQATLPGGAVQGAGIPPGGPGTSAGAQRGGGGGGAGAVAGGLADDPRQRLGRDASAESGRAVGVIGRIFSRTPREAAAPPPPAWRRATVDEAVRRFGGPVLRIAGLHVDAVWIVEEGALWSVRVVHSAESGVALTVVQWRDTPPPAGRASAEGDVVTPMLLRSAQRPDGTTSAIFELADGSRVSIEGALPLDALIGLATQLRPLGG